MQLRLLHAFDRLKSPGLWLSVVRGHCVHQQNPRGAGRVTQETNTEQCPYLGDESGNPFILTRLRPVMISHRERLVRVNSDTLCDRLLRLNSGLRFERFVWANLGLQSECSGYHRS